MEKLQFEEGNQQESKKLVTNEDLNDSIVKLTSKIDLLTKKLTSVEQKVDELYKSGLSKEIKKNEVEIEERLDVEENYLTPNELIGENPAIHNTGIKLISFRIATASEIARVTKKERAVESFYLNDLWNRNRIRKLRIGRKIYFYIGKSQEISPFKNPIIKPDWRDALISIIRELTTFETSKKVKIKNIVRNYLEYIQSEDPNETKTYNSEAEEFNLMKILEDIAQNTKFLSFEPMSDRIEFKASEWLKLA